MKLIISGLSEGQNIGAQVLRHGSVVGGHQAAALAVTLYQHRINAIGAGARH
jgi:broad specificity polyphosphatase/5'/3'-nucleotidase SurE